MCIRDSGTLARTLNENRDTVDGVLERLPGKLDRIIGTATYGSWFNFYLCGSKGTLSIGDTPIPGLEDYELVNPAGRCRFGVGEAPDGSDAP